MQTSFFPDQQSTKKPYQVLARKYRPHDFENMVGQEAMVQTFRNAIKSGRIAHAFLLTGIRGVGKTTTARIMAKALNCIGEDGTYDSPMEQPCGKCIHCTAINEDRHQDILELDAASHTGVSDMREVIDNVKYRPVSGRYKVYIIDEAHMLSNSAFNALLKTLEEPPAHTKFILATTEVRKIPATILSRCQRFDLKRVDPEVLQQHFINIATQEGANMEETAAGLIANVAAGSVRDGLSILDQAIALSESEVSYQIVSSMLGLADLESRLDLFIHIAQGETTRVLSIAKELYNRGVDPALLLQDMLETVHLVTKIKILQLDPSQTHGPSEAQKYKNLASKLTVAFLNRAWQIISKGIEEVKSAYHPFAACEMVLIRLIYSSTLPSVEELLRGNNFTSPQEAAPVQASIPQVRAEVEEYKSTPSSPSELDAQYLLQLCLEHEEMMLHHHVMADLVIIQIDHGHIKVKLKDSAPKALQRQLQEFLHKATGSAWSITQGETEALTISEQQIAAEDSKQQEIIDHPSIQDILNTFTDLEIADIKPIKSS